MSRMRGQVSVACGNCGWSTWRVPTHRSARWVDRLTVRLLERAVLLHHRFGCPARSLHDDH